MMVFNFKINKIILLQLIFVLGTCTFDTADLCGFVVIKNEEDDCPWLQGNNIAGLPLDHTPVNGEQNLFTTNITSYLNITRRTRITRITFQREFGLVWDFSLHSAYNPFFLNSSFVACYYYDICFFLLLHPCCSIREVTCVRGMHIAHLMHGIFIPGYPY